MLFERVILEEKINKRTIFKVDKLIKFCLIKYPEDSPGILFGVVRHEALTRILWLGKRTTCSVFGVDNCELVKFGNYYQCQKSLTLYQLQYMREKENEAWKQEEKNNKQPNYVQHTMNQYLKK